MGNSVVIDAKRFATVYNAFWHSAAPTCDLFVRRANLDGYDRVDAPLKGPPENARRPLSAEYAFSRFGIEHEIRNGVIGPLSEEEMHTHAWQKTIERLRPYALQGLDIDSPFSDEEKTDSLTVAKRLMQFFSEQHPTLIIRPRFVGCGYIDMSEGDVLVGSTLFEVKTVDRTIRSSDLRQLLTYAALNKSASTFVLDRVGLFNPRRGISAEFDLEDVCLGISGKTAEGLLSEIIGTVSSGEMSR